MHRDHSVRHFKRDFVEEWGFHLLSRIRQELRQSEQLVAEGYLLKDCAQWLQASLANDAQVFHIKVENQRYYLQGELLTIDQVAALGATPDE